MSDEISLSTDDWVAKFMAGEWVPMSVVEANDALRLRLREFPIYYKLAYDPLIKIRLPSE